MRARLPCPIKNGLPSVTDSIATSVTVTVEYRRFSPTLGQSLTARPNLKFTATVQPVYVGPVAGQIDLKWSFTSVTTCGYRSLDRTAVAGALVDTGSARLRVLESRTLSRPALNNRNRNTVNQCSKFSDNSGLGGKVAVADRRIGCAAAGSISTQTSADPSRFTIQSAPRWAHTIEVFRALA